MQRHPFAQRERSKRYSGKPARGAQAREISESSKGKVSFEYNSHLSRTRMDYDYRMLLPNTAREKRKTKLYTDDGSTEVIIDHAAHTVTINTFIGGDAYSAVAYSKTVKNLAAGTVTPAERFYLHRDYLGSILAISNSAGAAVEQRHFDAWGSLAKIVGANGVAGSTASGLQFFDRGYTSHEHLQEVRLIHMNGRLYDPMLRGFLMPDNYVQAPENTQSYNRYAYCMNNPLSYSDPSGEYGIAELATAVVIAVVVAALTYTATTMFTGASFSWGGFAQSVTIGAISGAVTFGIGSACSSMVSTSCFAVRAGVQALAHGVFQGTLAATTGGSFWTGFASGALSSIAASAWSADFNGADNPGIGWAHGLRESGAGMIAFGTVAGGAGAELTGGNFWVGAATGLVVSGCNHAMHEIQNKYDYSNNGEIFESQGELEDYVNSNVGDLRQIEKGLNTDISLATQDNLPDGYKLIDNDIIGPKGRAGGVTVSTGINSSNIFIAPSLKGDYFGKVRMTSPGIVHELLHAYHNFKGLPNYLKYSEAATSTYTYAYLKAYGSSKGASFYLPNSFLSRTI